MKRRLGVLACATLLSGCVDTSVVLHVAPDGHGRVVMSTRLYEAGLRAFDSLFTSPSRVTPLDQELPTPTPSELARVFGSAMTLTSSKLDRTVDGAIRTSVAEFDDVRALRMLFPPSFTIGGGFVGTAAVPDQLVVTFAMKPHDNGDRLLLVRLPDGRVPSNAGSGADDITVFKTDSPEERAFKQAIKNMALRLYVELDDTVLLRTNAPVTKGNRATILDLDLDKILNGLDEEKARRATTQGSMQEVLWQLGDMPGAIVPTEHDVFLEFEAPQQTPSAQPPRSQPQTPAQAPPDTEIYLAPLKTANGTIEVGAAANISNSRGYDNQPFFTPDGGAVLFTSVRGSGTQTDIYRYDLASKRIAQVTATSESEYSPTVTPADALSVVRVELDGNNTQRLWQFTQAGTDPKAVLENVKPVGYHAWANDHSLALFVLGQPATLQLADTRNGTARVVATDIGRSIQRMPGTGETREISFVQRERAGDSVRLVIKKLNVTTGEITVLTPAVDGATEADTAWMPDGTLLMAHGGTLYAWRAGRSGWTPIVELQRLSLSGVTRLAVSPKGDLLALVGSPR
jgi:hypothetical protein